MAFPLEIISSGIDILQKNIHDTSITSFKYTKNRMLPYVAGFYGGLFTLVHYGSILRTSNIVLFYSFFGMSIRMYVLSRKHIHLSN